MQGVEGRGTGARSREQYKRHAPHSNLEQEHYQKGTQLSAVILTVVT